MSQDRREREYIGSSNVKRKKTVFRLREESGATPFETSIDMDPLLCRSDYCTESTALAIMITNNSTNTLLQVFHH